MFVSSRSKHSVISTSPEVTPMPSHHEVTNGFLELLLLRPCSQVGCQEVFMWPVTTRDSQREYKSWIWHSWLSDDHNKRLWCYSRHMKLSYYSIMVAFWIRNASRGSFTLTVISSTFALPPNFSSSNCGCKTIIALLLIIFVFLWTIDFAPHSNNSCNFA